MSQVLAAHTASQGLFFHFRSPSLQASSASVVCNPT